MLSGRIILCVVFIAVFRAVTAWNEATSAALPFLPARLADLGEITDNNVPSDGSMDLDKRHPIEVVRGRVREGVPPPLCAGRCASPPAGPVCAFDATGTARTFRTLCELEAVSCRESTHYAITSLGEC